jgi:hypothetical protein
MDDKFTDDEKLFRAVKANPNLWKENENRPSSAIFKDSKGVSVDRQADRNVQESLDTIISNFEETPLKAIISVTINDCNEAGVIVKYDPSYKNKYHSVIYNSADVTELSSGKARFLSKRSVIYTVK